MPAFVADQRRMDANGIACFQSRMVPTTTRLGGTVDVVRAEFSYDVGEECLLFEKDDRCNCVVGAYLGYKGGVS